MLTSKRDSSGWLEGVNFVNLEFFVEKCEKPQKTTKTITPFFHTKNTHSSCPTPRKRKTGQLTTPPLRGGRSCKHSESPNHPFLKRDSSGQLGQLDRKIKQEFDIEYGLAEEGRARDLSIHYTYIHYRLDNGLPFYIGKGVKGRYETSKNRNKYWHHTVNKAGFRAVIVAQWSEPKEALDHEVRLIKAYKSAGFKLCNLTEGGEGTVGCVHSSETRAKISEASKLRMQNPETRAKLHNPETRAKMSEKAKLRMQNPEHRKKIAEGHARYYTNQKALKELGAHQ